MPLIRIFSETYYEMYRHRKSTLTLYCAEFACGAYEGLIALVLPFRRGRTLPSPAQQNLENVLIKSRTLLGVSCDRKRDRH